MNIFLGLHDCCNRMYSPYYNNLQFDFETCLSSYVNKCPTSIKNSVPISTLQKKLDSYELNTEVTTKLQNMTEGVLGNLFYVESNSAHQLSYFLACQAYEEIREVSSTINMAVINFDQHGDYGSASENLGCHNWGYKLSHDTIIDYYVTGNPKGSKATSACAAYCNNEEIDFLNVNDYLRNYDYIYVTVDMDVINGVENCYRTNWPNGGIDKDIFCIYIATCLEEVNVIAADITGFPLKDVFSVKTAKDYCNDIESVANILRGFIKPVEETLG